MKIYHYELGIPDNVKTRFGVLTLTHSYHATQAASARRRIQLPKRINTDTAKVIEVEVDEFGTTTKVLYRVKYNLDYDLVMAVIPSSCVLKTVWLNHKKDSHRTLDMSRYEVIN